MKQIYIVDCENLPYKIKFDVFQDIDVEIYYVVGNTKDNSVWSLVESYEHIVDFEHNKCHDAADGLVCTVFGFLVSKYGYDYKYVIFSRNRGFDDTVGLFKDLGYDVSRETDRFVNLRT